MVVVVGEGRGAVSARCRLGYLTCSRPDGQTLTSKLERKVRNKDEKIKWRKRDSDSGRDSNLRPGKWPAML